MCVFVFIKWILCNISRNPEIYVYRGFPYKKVSKNKDLTISGTLEEPPFYKHALVFLSLLRSSVISVSVINPSFIHLSLVTSLSWAWSQYIQCLPGDRWLRSGNTPWMGPQSTAGHGTHTLTHLLKPKKWFRVADWPADVLLRGGRKSENQEQTLHWLYLEIQSQIHEK